MSRMNEMWHGDLETVQSHLTGDIPTLEETQCALINAISHIRTLERQVERLQNQVGGLLDRGN